MSKDYYEILGLDKNTTDDELKKAYRKLAMQYHPDRNPGKETWANEKFKEINEAYSILGDPQKRQQYDQFGTVGNIGDIFTSSNTRTTFEDLVKDFNGAGLRLDFLDTIFGDLFKGKGFSFKVFRDGFNSTGGSGFGGTTGINLDDLLSQTQRAQQRDVTYEITVSQQQVTKGLEKDLVRKGKKLRVKIPAGTKSKTTIRLRNAKQITDGQPGDIFVRVLII